MSLWTRYDENPDLPNIPVPGNVYQPHNAEGRHMRRLDEQEQGRQSWITFKIFGILIVLASIYFYVTNSYRNATTPDTVKIVELNPRLENISKAGVLHKCSSITEAEDWLLAEGYVKRQILTRRPFKDFTMPSEESGYWKTFPVKGEPTSKDESVIVLKVDYGNGAEHVLPFTSTKGDNPIDFSRFKWAPYSPNRYGLFRHEKCVGFELGYYSTHDNASFADKAMHKPPISTYLPDRYSHNRELVDGPPPVLTKDEQEAEAERRKRKTFEWSSQILRGED